MLVKLYSVKDEKSHLFGQIFPAKSDSDASRMLAIAVQDKNVQIGMFPEDFALYEVGLFDDEIGSFTSITTNPPRFVCGAVSFVKLGGNNAD